MDIDKRLDRLTERHEALAQSLELITHDISELRSGEAAAKERLEALRQSVELLIADGKETGQKIRALAILAEQNEVRAGRNENRMVQMMDAITSMARAVEAHEQRFGRLEN
jgi:plasmid stabilization system protein ParE